MTALILPSDIRLPLRRKWTLVRTGAVQRTIEDHRLFRKICIYTSRHIIINTDGEEETGKSRMGRSRWDTDICYNLQRTLNRNCYHAVSNQFRKQFMWTDIKHWLIDLTHRSERKDRLLLCWWWSDKSCGEWTFLHDLLPRGDKTCCGDKTYR